MLGDYVESPKFGEIISEQEFRFNENAHAPDLAFIRSENVHLIDNDRRIQLFVPDLAIEIVSRHDKFEKLMEKTVRYRNCGTNEMWVLSPRTRRAFVQSEDRELVLRDHQMFESKLIPGFSIRLGELFDCV